MMTEYELLKQGKDQYMSDVQKDFFRSKLLGMKKQTEERLQKTRAIMSKLSMSSGSLDKATGSEICDITLIRIKRDVYVYHEIELALGRLRQDTFGYCEKTGMPLGIPRLLANPFAKYTVSALIRYGCDTGRKVTHDLKIEL